MNGWWSALAAVLVLVVVGCADADAGDGRSGGDADVVMGDLEGRTFTATQVRGHDLVDGTEVTLSFDAEHVSARAGCNTMFGQARIEDGVLRLPMEGLATTLMACPQAQEAQDRWLLALLESSPRVVLDGERLELGDDVTGMTLTEGEG